MSTVTYCPACHADAKFCERFEHKAMWQELPQFIATPLPDDAKTRKIIPMYSGLVAYFPKALAAVAHCSWVGNEQHNPGTPLHWNRSKSGDERDALMRHLVEAGTVDRDGVRHSAKVAWRALAALEKELEDAECRPDLGR